MARTDANPPMPEFREDYVLQEVDAAWLGKAVKPKQFIHIDQSECIMCEGCVDICPWKCIHMVATEAVDESIGVDQPGLDPSDRCPTGVIIMGKVGDPDPAGDFHQRTNTHGYGYGMRLG
jgi:formate hydrogenlyase subunit 6/NADH:ubiquinone oxidoreductase subunit I